MVKFLYPTKNNKASILPVTVIAMFIMMIVAYACIKMFLVQAVQQFYLILEGGAVDGLTLFI